MKKIQILVLLLVSTFVFGGVSYAEVSSEAAASDKKSHVEGFLVGTGDTMTGVSVGAGEIITGAADGAGKVINRTGEETGKAVDGFARGTQKVYEKTYRK